MSDREAGNRWQKLADEAERAFKAKPKAMWSDRTYIAPKDLPALRALLAGRDTEIAP